MRKVPVRVEQTEDGEWWVNSTEAVGFFACGETRKEALDNARDALSVFLGVDEKTIILDITDEETKPDSQ